jgi:hypothetical protein
MIGCTTQVEPEKPKQVESTHSVEKISKWDPEKKQFWIAMVFAQMTQNIKVRQTFMPIHLWKVVVCAMDIYEKEYELDYFEENFGNKSGKLTPELSAVAYTVTYGCTQKQLLLQQKELLKNTLKSQTTI